MRNCPRPRRCVLRPCGLQFYEKTLFPRRVARRAQVTLICAAMACSSGPNESEPTGVATVEVSPPSASMQVGSMVQFTATAKDARGRELSGQTFTWSTADPTLATVTSTGLVAGVSAGGPVSVAATTGGRSGTAAVTVTPIPVASVVVTPPTATIDSGATVQLVATPRDASGNVLTGRGASWTSANPTVASVNSSGLVSGLSPGGPVSVTATVEGRQGSAVVSVMPVIAGLPLPDGAYYAGEINPLNDIDRYVFGAAAGDVVSIRIANGGIIAPQPGGCWNPAMELYRNASLVRQAASSCFTIQFTTIDTTLLAGRHLLLVSDHASNATGRYALTTVRLSNPSGTTLSYGSARLDSIARLNEVDRFLFNGISGEVVSIRVANGGILTPQPGGCWNPAMELYKDARLVKKSRSSCFTTTFAQIDTTLSTTGTYLLLVADDFINASGRYSLNLQRLSASPSSKVR